MDTPLGVAALARKAAELGMSPHDPSFADLPRNHYGAILADPPWRFRTWSETDQTRAPSNHYGIMQDTEIAAIQSWISQPMIACFPVVLLADTV